MKTFNYILLMFAIFSTALVIGCGDDGEPGDKNKTGDVASCEGCHTNYDHLKAVASPDTAVVGGGCGGDAPHYEPYDRVHLGGTGFDAFKKSTHYTKSCVDCHNGVGDTDDKSIAHSGDFLKHPSTKAQEKCASCHAEEVSDAHNSIHQQGWGQKRKVTIRAGLSGAQDFADLPPDVIDGYNHNCATCHASTCGDCHVNRPPAGGGGLMNGHNFTEPEMVSTCVTCHKTRGGHAFLGVAPGSKPDVHQQKGFDCMDCHKESDVHGDGQIYDQRYAVKGLVECTDCHSSVANSNQYHSKHIDDFSCYTCHSQDYNSCGNCHVGGLGARLTSHQDFKIGLNPIPDLKPGYKFALVRMTPAAPDAWEQYGMAQYSNFDALPTYNYTSPHNIQKITSRTDVGDAFCGSKCHIRKDGDTFINKELYLFQENLKPYEVNATKGITVDGKLPESWEVK